jgi:penicillin-binding protein 1A
MLRLGKLLLVLSLLLAGASLLAFLAFEATVLLVESSLPEVVDRPRFDRDVWKVSRFYSRDGAELAEMYRERRTIIDADTLPRHVLDAVVAAEDRNFHTHEGVDWVAIVRAAGRDLLQGTLAQGGSTLTQQLARNLYLNRRKTIWRKVQEALLARKIENSLAKEDILHQYLNLIYWGHGRYGIEEAARFYFGKAAASLTLGEAALLAGIIKGPELLSPLKDPGRARERMEYVLNRMHEDGLLEPGTKKVSFPRVEWKRATQAEIAPYAVDYARVELGRLVPGVELDSAGLQTTLTVESSAQRAMNLAVLEQLPGLKPALAWREEAPESLCDCMLDGEVRSGCPIWARVAGPAREGKGLTVEMLGRLGVVPAAVIERLAGMGIAVPEFREGDYLRVIPSHSFSPAAPWLTEEMLAVPLVAPQVAAVLMDSKDGRIVALFGGLDPQVHPYNRALSARRPIGSTIKPFIYLAAMLELGWDADTQVEAGPLDLVGPGGKPWPIRDQHPHSDSLDIEEALAWSSNCAAARTLRQIGPARFVELWASWGLPPLDAHDLSLALGSATLTPLELARAYALLANGHCTPTARILDRVVDPTGSALRLPETPCRRLDAADALAAIRRALSGVVRYGTGKSAQVAGLDAVGKTGTSAGGRDAWFSGLVGRHVLVVWVGSDDYSPLEGNSGPTTAAKVWHAIAERTF